MSLHSQSSGFCFHVVVHKWLEMLSNKSMLSKTAKWALDPFLPGVGIKLNTSEVLKLNGLKFHFGFRYIHWDHLSSNYYHWLDPDILLLHWKLLCEKIVLGKKIF